MKKRLRPALAGLLCLGMALLAGCNTTAEDAAPVWEGTLPASGVRVTVSGCTLDGEGTLPLWDKEEQPITDAAVYLTTSGGHPSVLLDGVEQMELQLEFAAPFETGKILHPDAAPVGKLDYKVLTPPEGVGYELDTYYPFALIVATDAGTDYLVVEPAQGNE